MNTIKTPVTLAAVVAVLCAAAGCAWHRPFAQTEERLTNGVVMIRTTRSLTFALWPATSLLDKQKITNGKTHGIGIEGLEQQTGGTNVIEALKALDSILGKIRP